MNVLDDDRCSMERIMREVQKKKNNTLGVLIE